MRGVRVPTSASVASFAGVCVVTAALNGTSACASIAGLNDYSSNCSGTCGDATFDRIADASSDVPVQEGSSSGSAGLEDAASSGVMSSDGGTGDEPSDGGPGVGDAVACDGPSCAPSSSDAATWTCAKGGCNHEGGACGSAEGCYCAADNQCPSGKCVLGAGRNDVACGSGCTGAGPADGFQCALATPGIPPTCSGSTFAYTPANLTSSQLGALTPVGAVNLSCSGTVTYDGSKWGGATCSQTLPAAHAITQNGGPTIDVLAFESLTIAGGVTLQLSGPHAISIVVFGDASLSGTIHADGSPGTSNNGSTGSSGPGGNSNCGNGTGGAGGSSHTSGGGGGGGQTAGGAGADGVGGNGGAGGSALGSSATTPLRGGCPGGSSGDWACTTSGGGGGGALQISVAGRLSIAGVVTASGGAGGSSSCQSGGCAPGPNNTYGGGAGGGGSGGTVVLEGPTVTVTGTVTVNGGSGGNPDPSLKEMGKGGAGATSASQSGAPGTGSANGLCGSDDESGGGGGGGYGAAVTSSGKAGTFACVTSLTPTPVCKLDHSGCVCVADSDCATGRCVNVDSQCSGTCTGTGAADAVDCAPAVAFAVTSP